MNARKFEYSEHAELVSKWLVKHKFPLPPAQLLPEIGFIVDESACGFLYTTNSKMALLEWVFANPEKTHEERAQALDLVFKLLEETARNLGVEVLFSASMIPAYSKVLERNQFSETDKGVSHFVKILREK